MKKRHLLTFLFLGCCLVAMAQTYTLDDKWVDCGQGVQLPDFSSAEQTLVFPAKNCHYPATPSKRAYTSRSFPCATTPKTPTAIIGRPSSCWTD